MWEIILFIRSNFSLVVIYQFRLLMVKKEFYLFIILMDEVQVMHSLWLKQKIKHHKLYLNIKKQWERDILNYFVVRQLKFNRWVEKSISLIEYFECLSKVFRRSQDPKNFQTSLKDIPFAPLPMLPPEMLTGGNAKDCIRVRNLPVECGIEQILEFLGVHSQHIVREFFISNSIKLFFHRLPKVFIWSTMFM